MADIINLRRVRKRKERETREQIAAEQRLRFGRPKVERRADAAREELLVPKSQGLEFDSKLLRKVDDALARARALQNEATAQ